MQIDTGRPRAGAPGPSGILGIFQEPGAGGESRSAPLDDRRILILVLVLVLVVVVVVVVVVVLVVAAY